MKEILLTHGKVALIDDDNFDVINQYKWHYCNGYAVRTQNICKRRAITKKHTVYMHKEIANAPQGMEADHINGNTLDNRKQNLRVVTHQQNGYNLKRYKNNKTGYKGVFQDKRLRNKQYYALIRVNRKLIHLGRYNTAEEAAEVYNQYAIQYHQEYGRLNVIY